MGKVAFSIGTLATVVLATAASAKAPKDAWAVTRVADPITGASSCVVAAYDQFGSMKYTRIGALYPVVENNKQLGLLVGVSSGGKVRLPTGDIVWRVDDRPHRTLRAVDNPTTASGLPVATPPSSGNPATDKVIADGMAAAMRTAGAVSATSTVASGEKATEMLREMLAGRGLLFRQEAASPTYGLPSSQTYAVGQYTSEGQRPIPIDDSFRRGLQACGIALPAAPAP